MQVLARASDEMTHDSLLCQGFDLHRVIGVKRH